MASAVHPLMCVSKETKKMESADHSEDFRTI